MINIYDKGFGTIYKEPMKNNKLSIEAKGIYAYLCAYAGKDNETYPTLKLILFELNITQERFYKHLKQLIEFGYIKSNKVRLPNGLYYKTVYMINKEIYPFADFPQQDKPTMDNHIQTSKNNTSNNNTINTVFKGKKINKLNKEKNKSIFGDTVDTFDMEGYTKYYNKLSVEERKEKFLCSPLVKLETLKYKQ